MCRLRRGNGEHNIMVALLHKEDAMSMPTTDKPWTVWRDDAIARRVKRLAKDIRGEIRSMNSARRRQDVREMAAKIVQDY